MYSRRLWKEPADVGMSLAVFTVTLAAWTLGVYLYGLLLGYLLWG
jgi:hypothetical protein